MQSPALFLSRPCTVADQLARRHRLARLGLAWLANMQVMMFAFPGYFRDEVSGTDNLAVLTRAVIAMNWVSLALTVPVVLYCAWPVWRGAWRRLARRSPPGGHNHAGVSMDVPVALGIIAAFIPSAWSTVSNRGEVYFESVTMFVAFLLTARYLEEAARARLARPHPVLLRLHAELSAQAERLAFWFVVVQLTLAALVGAFWWAWQPAQALPVTVALLVMSCPCAMAMALPSAMAAAHACTRASTQPLPEAALPFLAQASARVTQQNLTGAIVWHLLMVPLAAFGLVAPWLAAIAMLVSSLAVAANSWWLYRRASVALRAGVRSARNTGRGSRCWR